MTAKHYQHTAGLPALLLIAAVTLATGCGTLEQHLGTPLSLDEVDQIESGSHYSSVLEMFGPPTVMTTLPSGMAFQYEYIRLVERQWGLILPGKLGKWIKAVYATADADIQLMTFIFDGEGKLGGADAQQWLADAGAGFSFSLIFSAGALTDTERYTESSTGVLQWGSGLIDPPLKTLNAHSSLETGRNGFQLTATTPRAGQHTLEMQD